MIVEIFCNLGHLYRLEKSEEILSVRLTQVFGK